MHRLTTSILTVAAVILTAGLAFAAPSMPGDLKLGPPEGWKAKKPLVDFSHAAHDRAKIDCVTCHHTWDGASAIQGCSTAGCHDQTGKRGANTFYAAFHDKKAESSCLGCHKATNKREKTKLPLSCKHCHSK